MPDHEKFQMMCALAAADQLPVEERHELEKHAEVCRECAGNLEDFGSIIEDLKREEGEQEDTSVALRSEGRKFANFAHRHGIRFSRAGEEAITRGPGGSVWWRAWTWAAAATSILLVIAAGGFSYTPMTTPATVPVAQLEPVTVPTEPDGIRIQHPRLDQPGSSGRLEQEKMKLAALVAERDRLKEQLAERYLVIRNLESNVANVNNQHATDVAAINELNQKNDSIKADLVAANVRENELREQVQAKQEAVEQERQLSAAAKDVRALMGARRLFMIDVYDGEDIARSKRSFGRIFYTQGKSLIFYAFDLDKDRSIKRVTFKAWGQRGKDPASIKSLGVFHVDDAVQKRWVMKVDDPAKLASIDGIFVTVESSPGADRPSGQKLMYAYLGGQPNHP